MRYFHNLFFSGVGSRKSNVLANGPIKQKRFLQHDAYLRSTANCTFEIKTIDQKPLATGRTEMLKPNR